MSKLTGVAMAALQQQQRFNDILADALVLLAIRDTDAAAPLVKRYREAVESNIADYEIIQSGAGIPRE